MAQVGYIRVSSTDQNVERQLQGVELDKSFTDKASGKNTDRPGWQACREYLREGDTLHVHSIDRLGRSMSDLLRIVDELTGKGISIHFHKENLVFSAGGADPMQKLQFSMLAAFAEFERALIRERQREGIELAKAAGKYKGRKPVANAELRARIDGMLESGKSKAEVAAELGISRTTLYKALSM